VNRGGGGGVRRSEEEEGERGVRSTCLGHHILLYWTTIDRQQQLMG